MKRISPRLTAWLLCLCLTVSMTVATAQAQETDYAQLSRQLTDAQRTALTGGAPLLSAQDTLPAGQSSVADWYAVAMARAALADDYDTYLTALKRYVENAYAGEGLSDRKATEYHRIALAVTALGGDASSFGTRPDGSAIDLIADGCYSCVIEGGPGAQGLNGWIFALLTLDSGGYAVPEDALYTRETILAALLDGQNEEGGFSLNGGETDVDVTAMALQALAPYQAQYPETVDRALAALSALQGESGGFSSWGAENAESCAQVVMALCALGIDPDGDSRFIKSGGSAVDALLSFRTEDGSFAHVDVSDPMASEQALQALEALRRFYAGENRFFDMTDAGAPVQAQPSDATEQDAPDAPDEKTPVLAYILPAAALIAAAGIILHRKGKKAHE